MMATVPRSSLPSRTIVDDALHGSERSARPRAVSPLFYGGALNETAHGHKLRHRQRLIDYLSRMLRNNRPLRYLRPIFLIDILYKAINWEGTALTPRNDQLSAVPREISLKAVLIGEAYSFQGKGVGCLDEPFIILIH
jgi:hypothetical protein